MAPVVTCGQQDILIEGAQVRCVQAMRAAVTVRVQPDCPWQLLLVAADKAALFAVLRCSCHGRAAVWVTCMYKGNGLVVFRSQL